MTAALERRNPAKFSAVLAVLAAVLVLVASPGLPVAGADTEDAVDLSDSEPETNSPDATSDGPVLSALPEGECADGEVYDDGVAENGYSGNSSLIDTFDAVMEFTPQSYPAVYETVCLGLVSRAGADHEFTVRIWDDDGPGGNPGTLLDETDTLTVDDIPTDGIAANCRMYAVDISELDVVVPDGSVYIGVRWNPMDSPSRYICADETASTPRQPGFFDFHNPDQWETAQSVFGLYRALLVRAVEDTTPPETTITAGPAEGAYIVDPTPSLEFETDDPDAALECSIDGEPFGACTEPGSHTAAPLDDGAHTFAVRAVDAAANADPTPATRSFTVDTVAPETTITSGPDYGATIEEPTATFGFEADEEASFECSLDGVAFEPCSGTDTHTTGELAEGAHTLAVRATDLTGHTDPTPAIRTFLVAAPTEAEPDFRFEDVSTDHLFDFEIHWLADQGITQGCNPPLNDRYCPEEPITRGQMSAFLVRALNLPDADDQGFTDTAESVFTEEIDALAAAGITRGCNPPANDRYCPDEPITRGQMSAFLVRPLGLPGADDQGFTDTAESVFGPEIDALAAAGITRGCNPPANDHYCPDDSMSRGQMAAMLHRALTR